LNGHGTIQGGNPEGGGGGSGSYDEESLIAEGYDGLTADEVTIIHGMYMMCKEWSGVEWSGVLSLLSVML